MLAERGWVILLQSWPGVKLTVHIPNFSNECYINLKFQKHEHKKLSNGDYSALKKFRYASCSKYIKKCIKCIMFWNLRRFSQISQPVQKQPVYNFNTAFPSQRATQKTKFQPYKCRKSRNKMGAWKANGTMNQASGVILRIKWSA